MSKTSICYPKKSAKGLKGTLLRIGDDFIFRIKAENEEGFIDCAIFHNDMEIIIDDEDTYFYESKDGEVLLDHSPQTLGI